MPVKLVSRRRLPRNLVSVLVYMSPRTMFAVLITTRLIQLVNALGHIKLIFRFSSNNFA